MRAAAPGGMLDAVPLEQWRTGRLVGTVDQLAEQVAGWADLGVAELIVSAGPLPFSVDALDDLELLASALGAPTARGTNPGGATDPNGGAVT